MTVDASRSGWHPSPFLLGSAGCHAAGALAVALAPAHWLAVCSVLLANHVLLAGAGIWPQCRLLGPNLTHLPEAAARRGDVEYVFAFENRGVEVGVTLNHPHGQIYAYPFVTPRTTRMLEVAQRYQQTEGGNLWTTSWLPSRPRAPG